MLDRALHRPSAWGKALRLLTILSVALYLVPEGAHVFEMFIKLRLEPEAYMAAQRLYDGWALFGVVIVLALVLTLGLAIAVWRQRGPRWLVFLSFIALLGTQGLFWIFIFPMNVLTKNWTERPADFEAVRRQWEYAHAGNAALTLLALALLLCAVLADAEDE